MIVITPDIIQMFTENIKPVKDDGDSSFFRNNFRTDCKFS